MAINIGSTPTCRRGRDSVVVVASRCRGGGMERTGAAAGAGVDCSKYVGALRLPPRGRLFHPLVAAHALSRASTNSWQVR